MYWCHPRDTQLVSQWVLDTFLSKIVAPLPTNDDICIFCTGTAHESLPLHTFLLVPRSWTQISILLAFKNFGSTGSYCESTEHNFGDDKYVPGAAKNLQNKNRPKSKADRTFFCAPVVKPTSLENHALRSDAGIHLVRFPVPLTLIPSVIGFRESHCFPMFCEPLACMRVDL